MSKEQNKADSGPTKTIWTSKDECYDPPQFFYSSPSFPSAPLPPLPQVPVTAYHAAPAVHHVPTPVQPPVQLQPLPALPVTPYSNTPDVPMEDAPLIIEPPDVIIEDDQSDHLPYPNGWQLYHSRYTPPEGGHSPVSHEQILRWVYNDPCMICIRGSPPVSAGVT